MYYDNRLAMYKIWHLKTCYQITAFKANTCAEVLIPEAFLFHLEATEGQEWMRS